MEKYLYAGLLLFTICFTLPYSWDKKIYYLGKLKFVFPAFILTAFLFIPWDIFFADLGVWGFNPKYIIGVKLFLLPIEEWLFFVCVPFSCVFIHEAILYYTKTNISNHYTRTTTLIIIVFSALMCLFYFENAYTFSTFGLLLIFLCLQLFVIKTPQFGQFYITYLFVLIPFFLINSLLTGSFIDQEVVWYNNAENMGIRIGTVPFEDLFYNMLMLFMTLTMYEKLKAKYAVG